jgi:hypothetical protein
VALQAEVEVTDGVPKVDRDKLDLLKLVVDAAEKETDRTWIRYSIMLYSNTGLVAVLSVVATLKTPIAIVPLAVLGISISIAWMRVYRMSEYYQRRWNADAKALIEGDPFMAEWVRARSNVTRVRKPFKGGIYFAMQLVPASFIGIWVAAFSTAIVLASR